MNKIRSFIPWLLVAALSAVSFSFMLPAARGDSAVMDELAHIPAGYSYLKFFDYRLNPEHPPLVKAISALPLLFLNLNFPSNLPSWQEDINGQWTVGTQFLFESGNNPDQILFFARLGPMLLTLLLIIITYGLSSRLLGRWWALLPAAFLAFSPNILAHGHYVTTDIGAALGILAASWAFLNFLEHPNRRHLIIAGLIFGLAQLLKFSAVLLIPFFIIITAVYIIRNAADNLKNTSFKTKLSYLFREKIKAATQLLSVFLIGAVFTYAVYFIFTISYPTSRQQQDTTFILSSFAGGPTPVGVICRPARCLAEADIFLASHRLTQPLGEYLLGVLMVSQRSSAGNTGYFLGEISATGWTSYFPTVFFLKEPLPSLIFILAGFLLALIKMKRTLSRRGFTFREYLHTNFTEFSLLLFIIFYWIYSVTSPLNIGIRHILPTVPMLYILAASSVKNWIVAIPYRFSYGSFLRRFRSLLSVLAGGAAKFAALSALLIWLAIETITASPFFLSYFNQLGGGIMGGHRFVTDSNYDWGQDLKRLAAFTASRNIDKIAVDYFGGDSPSYRLGDSFAPWWSSKNNPREEGIEWLAVSVNTLASATAIPAPGFNRAPEDEYLWLKTARGFPVNFTEPPPPDFRAGTSIFIYKL